MEKEIDKLRSDTSTGIDQIPVKFLKLAKEQVSGPLTYVINRCIATISFLKLWKIARISPIPEVDEPLSDADYTSGLDSTDTLQSVGSLGSHLAHFLHQRRSVTRSYSNRIQERSLNNYCLTGEPRRSNTGIKERRSNTDGLHRS